jgi:N-acetylneuraminate synthase/N,N'-diacetyllegionaminate synthase
VDEPLRTVEIGGRLIGNGAPCLLIAEAGVNHDGDPQRALALLDAAADAGADFVKFQTFTAERLTARDAPKAPYQVETTGADESQQEMLRRLELPPEAYPALLARCEERGVGFVSAPFDELSVQLLVELGVPALKIPSGEITNPFLLEAAGATGKPVILSTGMADLTEVERAVATLRGAGTRELVVLHCVSAYPAEARFANLRAMASLEEALGVPVGFSDHTLGLAVPIAAAALGAGVIEKHLTLDRTLPGPDHRASLEPREFAELVRLVREVESALGDGAKRRVEPEDEIAVVARKSLAARVDLPAGTVLERPHLTALRPGTGIPPVEMDTVLGRRLRRPLAAAELVAPDDVE